MGDGDLPALYSGRELFLCSSFYEGFGFPPLEAMACGTPVLSSAGGSLAEVLGDAAVVRRDFELEGWVTDVRRLLSDETLRAEHRRRGLLQAAQYRWEKTAQQTWAVYRDVVAGTPLTLALSRKGRGDRLPASNEGFRTSGTIP